MSVSKRFPVQSQCLNLMTLYLRDAYFFDLKVKILNKTGTRFKLLNNTHVSGDDPYTC